MTLTIGDVRNVLNIPDKEELSDAVITQNMTSAGIMIDAINRGGASGPIVDEAKLRLASYLSYLSTADHIVHDLPGEIDQDEHRWQPTEDVIVRERSEKLAALKQASDEAIAAMISTFRRGRRPMMGSARIS